MAEVDTYGGGSFAGNFLKFNNNGAAQFTVDSTGNVVTVGNATIEKHAAIGANAQLNNDTLTSGLFTGTFNNVLTIEERLTDLSANNNFGVLNVLDLNPSVDTTNGVYGSLDLVQTNASNSTNYDYLVGTVGDVYHKGSGHITSAQGGDFEVGSDLAGIIDTAIGVGGGASGATNGTGGSFSVNKDAAITAPGQSYGIYSTASNIGVVNSGTDYTYGGRFAVGRTGATGGTINTYGNYISIQADDAGAGTSAAYGLLIDDTSSAADTNYAIYTNGTAPSSFGGNIIPGSTDAIDLGTSSSLEFNNVYAKVLHQGANLVCDTSGNCAAVGNYWRLNGLVLSPVQAAYDLTIGGNATGSAFQVFAATGNVVSAGYVRGGNLVIGGNGGQATCASVSDGLCGMNNLWETTPGTMYLMPGWNGSSSDQSHQLLIGSSNNNGKGFVAIDGQFGGNAAFTVKPAGAGPDVMSASSSAGLNLFVIRNSGNIGIGTILPDKTLEINSATGNNLRLTYNDADGSATNYTDFSLSASGDLTVTPSGGQLYLADTATLNVGGITNAGYNAFANASDTLAAGTNISADNDLFVGGDFGVNGNLYLLGHNIYNTYGGSSVGAITLATDPTALNTPNYLTDGSWFVQNSVNNGLAALMVDQEKGGDIFSASAAGATKFTISNSGQVAIGSAAPTKTLDVTGDIRLTGKLYDTNVTAGINLGDSSNTALVGFGAGSLVGALNELKTAMLKFLTMTMQTGQLITKPRPREAI